MRMALFFVLVVSSIAVVADPFRQVIIGSTQEAFQVQHDRVLSGIYQTPAVRRGNGKPVKATRDMAPFSAIALSIPAEVVYAPADDTQLELQADSNLLEIIETEVVGNTLNISAAEGFATRNPLRIVCNSPNLASAALYGSGSIDIQHISEPELALFLSGSGDMMVSGDVGRLAATLQGSGDIDASALQANKCQLAVQGSGDIRSFCIDVLVASVLGSGDIQVSGSPARSSISEMGAGSVDIR